MREAQWGSASESPQKSRGSKPALQGPAGWEGGWGGSDRGDTDTGVGTEQRAGGGLERWAGLMLGA